MSVRKIIITRSLLRIAYNYSVLSLYGRELAEDYNEIGDAAKTRSILDSIAPASEASKSLKYLALMPNILEQNGVLAGALQAYKDFYITIIGLRGKEVGEYMQFCG